MLRAVGTPSYNSIDGNPYKTTMLTTNTAAQNMAAWTADVAAAIAAGKELYIPAGSYAWGYTDGTQLTTNLANGDKLIIRGAGRDTELVVPSGSSAIPWVVTTEAVWADYPVTAISNVTSGGNISAAIDVTKLTITGSPTLVAGDLASVYSRDPLYYGLVSGSGDFELNYQHEMAEVLSVDGADIYLGRKLNRTYTQSLGCKMRVYNSHNTVFDMDDITFNTTGDIFNDAVTTAQRPALVFEVRGVRSPKVGSGVHFRNVWAGSASFNSTAYLDYRATSDGVANKSATQSFLGYSPRLDGLNFMPRFVNNFSEHGRHQPTTTWIEECLITFGTANYTAGATTKLGYTAVTGDEPNATNGDMIYIDMSTATGTINTMPVGWYTVLTNNSTSNWVTVDYNSTGLTYTAGAGTGWLFQPDQARRYGECDGMSVDGMRAAFPFGSLWDEHENAIGTRITNGEARFLSGFSWSSTAGYTVNNRGANLTVDGFYQEGGGGFAQIVSFSMNHGVSNTALLSNIHLHNQADLDSNAAYFETTGSSLVTQARKLVLNNINITGTYNQILYHAADAGDVEINGLKAQGVWGNTGTGDYAMLFAGGNNIVENAFFDFTNSPIAVKLCQLLAGNTTFKNCIFKGLAATASQLFDVRTGATIGLKFIDCTFEFSSSATDGSCRFLALNTATILNLDIINCQLINAAKVITSNGLVRAGTSGGTVNLKVENLVSDAVFTLSSATAGATVSTVGTANNSDKSKLLFKILAANMQLTTDQALTKMFVGTNYMITDVVGKRVSGGATVACTGGIYTSASKGGSALVAAAQSWLGMSGAGKIQVATPAAVNTTDFQTATPILSLTTGSTAACTADIYVYGLVLD